MARCRISGFATGLRDELRRLYGRIRVAILLSTSIQLLAFTFFVGFALNIRSKLGPVLE